MTSPRIDSTADICEPELCEPVATIERLCLSAATSSRSTSAYSSLVSMPTCVDGGNQEQKSSTREPYPSVALQCDGEKHGHPIRLWAARVVLVCRWDAQGAMERGTKQRVRQKGSWNLSENRRQFCLCKGRAWNGIVACKM